MNTTENDIKRIGGYIDDEISPFEMMLVKKSLEKYPELADLERNLRAQKQAIKDAFLLKLLGD